jgi:cobalt/nickel transport system permease protein
LGVAIVKAKITLLAYLAAVVLGTAVHEIGLLALGLSLVLVLAGRDWLRILRRACIAILFFNAVITLSYGVIAGIRGTFSLEFVVLVNLRVLLLTSLTFLFASRVNPFEALAFSRTLTYLFTLSYSQSMVFKQALVNFRLAFRSRCIEQVSLRDRYRHSARTGVYFLDKSLHQATEITQVMRSRGFFDD